MEQLDVTPETPLHSNVSETKVIEQVSFIYSCTHTIHIFIEVFEWL